MLRLSPFILLLAAIVSCAQRKQPVNTTQTRDNPYELLGKNIDSIPNSSGHLILYVQKHDLITRQPVLNAVVLQRSSSKVVATFRFTPGHIKWVAEDEVEVYDAPGTIRKDEDLSKYIKTTKIKTN